MYPATTDQKLRCPIVIGEVTLASRSLEERSLGQGTNLSVLENGRRRTFVFGIGIAEGIENSARKMTENALRFGI